MTVQITQESFEEQLPHFLSKLVRVAGVQNALVRRAKDGPPTLSFQSTQSNTKIEFAVTYHTSYNTPVLYFRRFELVEDVWTVSYEIHNQHCSIDEFQGMNWLFVHPCDSDTVVVDGSLDSWSSIYISPLLPLRSTDWFSM